MGGKVMYYPFLRGKQEELLALQELLDANRLSEKIIPIMEPYRLSSTLIKTLQLFCERKRKIYLVANPIVGQFEDDMSTELVGDETEEEKKQIQKLISNQKKFNEIIENEEIKFALYYKNDFLTYVSQVKGEILVLFTQDETLDDFIEKGFDREGQIEAVFVPNIEEIENVEKNPVLFRDRFNKAAKNADYPEDEFFSKDHMLFSKYGCSGFSDYSIVGAKYDEGGFTPYAIAIHIVYPNEKNILYIKHFVSDSNYSMKNPAGKFAEAAKKLQLWSNCNPNIQSLGLTRLIDCYQSKRYPGLGSLKRYSIMHHLETVGNILP